MLRWMPLLASDWSSNCHGFTDKTLSGLTSNLVDSVIVGFPGLIYFRSCSAEFVSNPGLTYDLWNSFWAFPEIEKLLTQLTSNLAGKLIMRLPGLLLLTAIPQWETCIHWCLLQLHPGPHFNIKTVFPKYEDSHVKDKTVARPSYL